METAIYYTLSTVSQALAGALGMLAAFLVFRVSSLEAGFNAGARELERRTQRWGAQASAKTRADLLALWRQALADSGGVGEQGAILAAM